MNTYVLSLAVSPPELAVRDRRCEELAFDTVRRALAQAGIDRRQIDAVTLATSDEMDGRSISSMLMAAPSGAYLKDELRVTDSGLTGLVMGALRTGSGRFHLGVVVSWSQTSQISIDDLGRMRAEPFALRPIGLNERIAEGLQAGALQRRLGLADAEVAQRVAQRQAQAGRNPRGLRAAASSAETIAASASIAWPLRQGHVAPITDGCVALVLASGDWLARHRGHKPLARVAAVTSGIDRYALDAERLGSAGLFDQTFADLLRRAGRPADGAVDVLEMEAQNGWQDLAMERHATQGRHIGAVNPSGGAWAQNPLFCTGLVNAAEAILQVAGAAGPVQVPGARFAVAHGSHGIAQQGHTFAAFERVDA